MAIFNMVQGKVPMTYRGVKTKLLAHFDNAANLAETAVYMNSGGAQSAFLNRSSVDLNGKFSSGVSLISATFDNLVPIGKTPFTIEFWLKPYSSNNNLCYVGFGESPSNDYLFAINYVNILIITSGYKVISPNLQTNTYTHVAIVGNGAADGTRSISALVNGVNIETKQYDYIFMNKKFFIVNSGFFNIDELRISNVARYAANFTPPTAPFAPD